jgi:hypothetical protein
VIRDGKPQHLDGAYSLGVARDELPSAFGGTPLKRGADLPVVDARPNIARLRARRSCNSRMLPGHSYAVRCYIVSLDTDMTFLPNLAISPNRGVRCCFFSGGSGAGDGTQHSTMAEQVFPPNETARTQDREGSDSTKIGRCALQDVAKGVQLRAVEKFGSIELLSGPPAPPQEFELVIMIELGPKRSMGRTELST